MKKKLSIQQRLILPILLLGAVALLSNILSVFSINNVNSNASKIVDNYMVGSEVLQNIRRTTTDIHKMALSHIVATDYDTMITVVAQIKEKEEVLEDYLEEYEAYIIEDERKVYEELLGNYDAFKHALVDLVCASADSRTQEAYAMANGDVASFAGAAEAELDRLSDSVSVQAEAARGALEDYVQSQIDANTDYRPAEIPKLESALVDRRGETLLLVVASDLDAAKGAVGLK